MRIANGAFWISGQMMVPKSPRPEQSLAVLVAWREGKKGASRAGGHRGSMGVMSEPTRNALQLVVSFFAATMV